MKALNSVGIAGAALAAVAATSKRATKTVADKVKATAERAGKIAKKAVAPKTWPHSHPHVNPFYRERKGGFVGREAMFTDEHMQTRHFITRQDVGRWMPHNGAREMARRVRQMEGPTNGAA